MFRVVSSPESMGNLHRRAGTMGPKSLLRGCPAVEYRGLEGAWAGGEERKAGMVWDPQGTQHRGDLETDWMRFCRHAVSRRYPASFYIWPLLETNILTTECPLL